MAEVTDHDIRELRRIRNKVDTLRGDGVTNKPNSISISAPAIQRRGGVGQGNPLQRYKVHTLPDPVSGITPCWAKCHTWNGTTEGTTDIAIRLVFPHTPGDFLYATQPIGGTDTSDDGTLTGETAATPIMWLEVQTLPTGWNCMLTRDDGGGTPVVAPTYTVKTTDGSATLSTTDSPLSPRVCDGLNVNVGENGFGYFGDEGVFVLWSTDETFIFGAC